MLVRLLHLTTMRLFGWLPRATRADAAFNALLHQLVGRRHTLRYAGRDVTLTVQRLDIAASQASLLVGHFGRGLLAATDISWPGGQLDRVVFTADDVRLWPAPAPAAVLKAASVRAEVTVGAQQLSTWLPTRRRVDLRVGQDSVLRLVLRAAPGLGSVELVPQVVESVIRLRPRAVRIGRLPRIPLRLPAYQLRLPQLPHRLRVTAVDTRPATITLSATIPRWEWALSTAAIAGLLARVASQHEPVDLSLTFNLGGSRSA